jgi:hypothetical protein
MFVVMTFAQEAQSKAVDISYLSHGALQLNSNDRVVCISNSEIM